ncbi:sulfite exporter TauE/SafE family protein [Pseudomonas sp. MTM4]|uniref:sulfite exporter TauE/SafE family protein n=1 Tax=unclassified Pseudomonas TaxID=196821 RepID=UPI0018D23E1B|nr:MULTISPECIES: sulfite exporter TauE/SafE family protein [unclassified Pseudomonas]MBC8648426.1 sulfite exporter TauE/SafE family protein [Pseudomonas sp. MT4]QXY90371.1 sulfite exporter TauE/SafE family protein [Pseudomonas sp. MTM4]
MDFVGFGLNVVLGLALGTLGGLFGIGGGLIAIPVLGVLFGLDQQVAQGTALVMVVPNVLLAIWRYHQRNRIDPRHAAALGIASFFFAIAGAAIAVSLDAGRMRIAFVGFLVALAAYTLLRVFIRSQPGSTELRHPWPWLGVLGAGAGALGGLFGVGGAVLATPVLTAVFGTSQVVAQGLSLSLAAPSTAVTLFAYATHDQVDWSLGLPLAVGGLLSISLGVKLAHALPERLLRVLFSGFLLLSAVMLAFEV